MSKTYKLPIVYCNIAKHGNCKIKLKALHTMNA